MSLQRPNYVKNSQGFTVIELIIVIVLIGILAVSAGPRIFGKGGVEEVVLEGQLLSLLRLQQQRAMQDPVQPCYGIDLSATSISPFDCTNAISPERVVQIPETLSLSISSLIPNASSALRFNSLGCPVSSAHATIAEVCGLSDVEFEILGVTTRYVCIQSQGYIRAEQCG